MPGPAGFPDHVVTLARADVDRVLVDLGRLRHRHALVGVSGALDYWAPIQPLLGLTSVGLLLASLAVRLRGERSCPLPRLGGVSAP